MRIFAHDPSDQTNCGRNSWRIALTSADRPGVTLVVKWQSPPEKRGDASLMAAAFWNKSFEALEKGLDADGVPHYRHSTPTDVTDKVSDDEKERILQTVARFLSKYCLAPEGERTNTATWL